MDALNESHPKLLEELVPKLLSLGEVGRVLEQLLRERVSMAMRSGSTPRPRKSPRACAASFDSGLTIEGLPPV